jgi:hypothetical protein
MTTIDYHVGQHVSLLTLDADDEATWSPLGKVMGFGTSNGQPIVIVQLDAPEYTESRQFFISVLAVHPSVLTLTRN